MALPRELTTERLLLRRWRPGDRRPFSQLNADPRVMEYFPAPLAREESDRMVQRIESHFGQHGFSLWALEVPGVVDFAGFVGLLIPSFKAPFTPCVEIGWRLAFEHWGRGYAPEAARAVLRFAFEQAGLREVLSFTATGNARSRRVMEKIGMRYDPADEFEHPNLPAGHRLRRHVLYRIKADEHQAIGARR